MSSSRSFTSKLITAVVVLALATAAFWFLHLRKAEATFRDIPIPFLTATDTSKGMITQIGRQGAILVFEVKLDENTSSENLDENKIYLVRTGSDTQTMKMDFAFAVAGEPSNHWVDYFGYKYSDANATLEKQNRNAATFAQRFQTPPGVFFASREARLKDASHGNALQRFEQDNGIIFKDTMGQNAVMLEPNSYYVFVVNTPVATLSKLLPSGPLCGNETVEQGEECDDGDLDNTNACTNMCLSTLCGNGNIDGIEQCDLGSAVNGQPGSSCDATCKLDPLPFSGGMPPSFKMTLVSQGIASGDTAVRNQTDIVLHRFLAAATSQDDVRLTSLAFDAASGNLANVSAYRLMQDTDNDNIPDTEVDTATAQGGFVTFDTIDTGVAAITQNTPVLFEVRGTVASSLVGDKTLSLDFAKTETTYVQAELVNGAVAITGIQTDNVCAGGGTCQIGVTTTASIVWTFVSQGSLHVSGVTPPPNPTKQMLMGTLQDTLLTLQMQAETENIEVTGIDVTAVGDVDGIDAIENVELWIVGDVQPLAVATIAACTAGPVPDNTFCADFNADQFIIAKGMNTSLAVHPRIKTDATSSALAAGKKVSFVIKKKSGAEESRVQAKGKVSNNNLADNNDDTEQDGEVVIRNDVGVGPDEDLTSNEHVLVAAKILGIDNRSADPDGTLVPSGVSSIAEFGVSAFPHSNTLNGSNDIVLNSAIFTVEANNVDLDPSTFRLYNSLDINNKAVCSVYDNQEQPVTGSIVTGQFYVACLNIDNANVNNAIDQSTEETFVLQAEVTQAQSVPGQFSSLQVKWEGLDQATATQLSVLNGSHIETLDVDGSTSSAMLWVDGLGPNKNGPLYMTFP